MVLNWWRWAGIRYEGKWKKIAPRTMTWMHQHRGLPTEFVVTAPELGGKAGFLGVYPREATLLEAWVFKGRALWRTLEKGVIEHLYLNAVTDPRVLWQVFKERAQARWDGAVFALDSSYLVLKTRIIEFNANGEHSSRLSLLITEAWYKPERLAPPSRVVGNLLDLMVALTRIDPLCTKEASRLAKQIEVSLSFLKRRLSTETHRDLLREIEDDVSEAIKRCPPLEKELNS